MSNIIRTFAERIVESERKFGLQGFMRLVSIPNFRSDSRLRKS
jgi:hypothetical protein